MNCLGLFISQLAWIISISEGSSSNITSYFHEKLHHRRLTGFWICICNAFKKCFGLCNIALGLILNWRGSMFDLPFFVMLRLGIIEVNIKRPLILHMFNIVVVKFRKQVWLNSARRIFKNSDFHSLTIPVTCISENCIEIKIKFKFLFSLFFLVSQKVLLRPLSPS